MYQISLKNFVLNVKMDFRELMRKKVGKGLDEWNFCIICFMERF